MAKSDEVPTVSTTENVKTKPKRRGCIGHCLRFWWIYLIVAVIGIVLVVVLVIFVGIPRIAQSKINDAQLTIQGIRVSNTQSTNYSMSINSTITTDGSVHANIDEFEGDMYLEDWPAHTPFAKVHFPPSTSDALVTVNVTEQFTQVTNMEEFTRFNTWLLRNNTLRVTVTGDTYVHLSGISKAFGVTFTKTVEMPGLRNFDGTNVTGAEISVAGFGDGNNFRGFASIPNYSLVTFEIGNASFHNYLFGEEIGTVYINDMILRPGLGGTNNFTMRANISQVPVLSAMATRPYCEAGQGTLPFQLRGKTVVNHGQPLSYFADALASGNQTVLIDIATPLKALNITVPCPS